MMTKKYKLLVALAGLTVCMASGALAQVQIHGFAQSQVDVESKSYSARIARYGLRIQQDVENEFNWLTEIYIHPTYTAATGRLYMESAWIEWNLEDRFPWKFRARFGKGRNECYGQAPYYSRRRTSSYSLYSQAFTQLRVVGFQTYSDFGPVQLSVGILNPYNNVPRITPDLAIDGQGILLPMSDRDNDESTIKRIGIAGRLGYKTEMINVGGSLYMSETGPGVNNEQNRFGLDGEVKLENGFVVQGQFTVARTSGLDHNGGEVLGGWESDKLGCYTKYGMLSYDGQYQGMSQIMLSCIYKVHPAIHLRLEALINKEEEDDAKGWTDQDNNRIFFETLFAF